MNIIEKSIVHVKSLFDKENNEKLLYHNWTHTLKVYEAAKLIANNSGELEKENIEIIELAALFHDVGYLYTIEGHEQKSAELAASFLTETHYPNDRIEEVKRLIMATKLDHTPSDFLEQIIIDADMANLGQEDYMETTFKNLSQEIKNQGEYKISEKDWAESCIIFLTAHKYLTKFARTTFGKVKEKNLQKVVENLKDVNAIKKQEKEKKRSQSNPLKGVETMFKTSLRNNVSLSRIADNKANTLISVNAIIISIVLSTLFPKLDSNPFLFFPGIAILSSSIVTIILAILSTIPNVNRGIISREEVKEKKGNLLFFGNFHKMKEEDFEWSMKELMEDKDYLYNTLSRDLFNLGVVLNKKYTFLRYSYFAFIIGLLISVIVFVYNVIPEIEG